MNFRLRFIIGSIVVLLATAVTATLSRLSPGAPAPTTIDTASRVFAARLSTYMDLRHRLIQRERADQLASALRDARRESHVGDVLCAEMAERIRQTVRIDFTQRSLADRAAVMADVPLVPEVHPNDFYPSGQPVATMPARLLQKLTPLPAPLEYRFLGDAVIVLDVDTQLIVDLVPHALPGGL